MPLIKRFLAAFRGTEFKGDVALQASEKLALLAAASTDGYEKREVLKDSKILQKVQEHQGQGVSYTDCKVERRLRIDTPHLEATSTLGARPKGVGIAEREEFTEVVHTLENRVEEHSGPVQKSLKSGFKAALSVGVVAIGAATGGIGSGIAGTLATTALTSSAVSFVNHGLESVMNHESLDLQRILKDTGKSLAVAGITQGLSAGLTELTSQAISEHSFSKIALRSLAHHGVYRQNLVQTVASQGIAKAAELGAGQIGQAYQGENINWAEHKLIHGALAMASTLGYGAIQGETTNWSNALIAATAVMGAESAAERWSKVLTQQDFQPKSGESKDAYLKRVQSEAEDWGRRSAACLRVLSASSLVLAGQGESTILAADLATDTALEHNFVKASIAISQDIAQGYLDVKEAWDEGNYWRAAGHLALTGAFVGIDAATQGFGTQAIKVGYRVLQSGRVVGRIIRAPVKKPDGRILKQEGNAGEGVQTRSQTEKASKTQKEIIESRGKPPMTHEEYLEARKGKQLPLGKFKDKKTNHEVLEIVQETGRYHEQHHVWPERQSKAFIKRGHKVKNNQIVIVPKEVHKADGRKLLHARNEKSIPECPRDSLAQGVSDARKGFHEAGYDVKETAENLLEGIKKIKDQNPGFFDKK